MTGATRFHALAAVALLGLVTGASAQLKKYDPGATDTEIMIGNIAPYSGPASAYSVHGRVAAAYFDMINEKGGIRGRKIKFISYDDAYSPAKTVEQARKLVEGDEVLFIFSPLGTPTNAAIAKYMNAKKVPQLFIASGATKFQNAAEFPWTMGFQPSYEREGQVYGSFISKNHANSKIGIFFQNDDFGRDIMRGLKRSLGNAATIVIEEPYEVTEPSIDSHIVKLKASGAGLLVHISSAKFTAQALKKVAELGWKPIQIVTNSSASIATVLRPAGLDNVQGIYSAAYLKDGSDPRWKDDAGIRDFHAFLDLYAPTINKDDSIIGFTYAAAEAVQQVLEQCGDELTRENVMKQAANLKQFAPKTTLPGIVINTSPTDYAPMKQLQIITFAGDRWQPEGPPLTGE
ncbi:branched-chain amino acid ABC transporter substrate-binding protein [Bradyrhizobium sp. LTSPM299]|uniref:ABC transporter substrate-binding protein n=1 Tax=Bradyrhizobium sp. LTSPM299 TaxID=1619233 RepID=UPI0005CB2214|nr:ABC transporter substrate-binding protein [Bradyrhizobium sp. LTSPM299]KJC60337.1 branched-chain amino acid ABC transporter substrate-binding protein [Bradyrhizobium sp. LTSPM299]